MSKTIRVMLVDDHAVVRSGLGAFLLVNKDMNLVGEAESGEDAIEKTSLLNPDVILMDLKMPGMGGVAAIRAIRQKYPEIRIIALTSYADEGLVQGALQAGAIGYLMKNVQAFELANAIRSVAVGRLTLSPEATEVLVQSATQPVIPGHDLTERERDVLKLMVDGKQNAEIAQELIISPSTVKYHIGNIYSKLGVDSRVAAVSLAIQRQLV
ncbi:MAG: DNA-binding response regulator [Anaerolineaceae bacterium]|nr:DNA-binding response regulator [Anaerolineaceae bacterium]